jgi:hypothetical protein
MDFVKALDLTETGVGVTTNLFKFGDVARADLFCVSVLTQESVEDVGAQGHHETVHLVGGLLNGPLVVPAEKDFLKLFVREFVLEPL